MTAQTELFVRSRRPAACFPVAARLFSMLGGLNMPDTRPPDFPRLPRELAMRPAR